MKRCSNCNLELDEGDKFCPACGAATIERATNGVAIGKQADGYSNEVAVGASAWVAGIQEEIKDFRGREISFGLIACIGVLFIGAPFIASIFITGSFDYVVVGWWCIPLGIAIAVFGGIMAQHYENIRKKLTRTLKGQRNE